MISSNSILTILLFGATTSFTQNIEIVDLLNKQFAKEQKMYDADYDADRPTLVQSFQIRNDTLSVAFSYTNDSKNECINHYREVYLKDIEGFEKDYNVLFTAKDGSVKEIITIKNAEGIVLQSKINHSNLLFTELRKHRKDKSLQQKMLKAFQKAGHPIKGEYWYN